MNYQSNTSQPNVKEYIATITPLLDIDKATTTETINAVNKIQDIMKIVVKNDRKDDQIKTHQLRSLYTLIRSADNVKCLIRIQPKLAYIGARQKGESGKYIVNILAGIIKKIVDQPDPVLQEKYITGIKYIMESIVAYHKFHINN